MLGFLFLHASSKTTTTYEYPPIRIDSPRAYVTDKEAANYTTPEDAKPYLTSLVGSETADSLIKKIKFSKSTGLNKIEVKAGLGSTTYRQFSQTYNVVNIIKFDDGIIQVRGSTIQGLAEVLSQIIIKTTTKRFLRKTKRSTSYQWRPLKSAELSQVYDKILEKASSKISSAITKAKTPEYKPPPKEVDIVFKHKQLRLIDDSLLIKDTEELKQLDVEKVFI